MTSFAAQLPTLVGVVVGAGASFFATFANERTRWQREREAKWDENRAVAYMEYGYAVKVVACQNICRLSILKRGLLNPPRMQIGE